MKIAFHNVNFGSRSGPNAFCTRLAKQLAIMDHCLVDPGDECDVDFINIASPSTKKRGKRALLRLDGIWTRQDQIVRNAPIVAAYKAVDTVVWQSSYDRALVERAWTSRPGTVIRNGACSFPASDPIAISSIRQLADVVFCACAAWHPQKRLHACVEAARAYAANTGLKTCIIIIGNTQQTIGGRDVFYAGDADERRCTSIISASDAMIHLAWRDHCPNACVEALAMGIPVVCASSGGTPELIDATCGTIIDDRHDHDIDALMFDYDDPPKIDVSGFMTFPKRGTFDATQFSIQVAASAYEAAMLEVLKV